MSTILSRLSIFLTLALLTTGCFEIIEEIKLNDDGSGSIEMTVNMSRSKAKLQSIMHMDSINGYKVPSLQNIKEGIEKLSSEIAKVPGASNVQHQLNFEDYIFSVSCDFTNIDVLNEIITHFSTDENARLNTTHKQFTYDQASKKFVRDYQYNLNKEIKKARKRDMEVLNNASVTSIYRFESPIQDASNTDAKIAGNRQAIMLSVDAQALINNTQNLKNIIQLK